jgi:hypothetical protein
MPADISPAVTRLFDASGGAHLGYGVVSFFAPVLADVAARLGAPSIQGETPYRVGEGMPTLWVWWPIETAFGGWSWEAALPYADRILMAIPYRLPDGTLTAEQNPDPARLAASVLAGGYRSLPVFGVGNPGSES